MVSAQMIQMLPLGFTCGNAFGVCRMRGDCRNGVGKQGLAD